MRLIEHLPWQVKILIALGRIIVSKIPKSYDFFRKLNIFRHGEMDQSEYAFNVFQFHFSRMKKFGKIDSRFSMVELGPGDSLFSAIVARASGAQKSYLVDVGDFAQKDVDIYKSFIKFLTTKGYNLPDYDNVRSFPEFLGLFNVTYLTKGLVSLKEIPSHSVDFIWSQSVLEHVMRSEFPCIIKELRRIIRSSGTMSHVIDLRDHLGNALNQLRVPSALWECKLNRTFGVYTNRIRYQEMRKCFKNAGFRCVFIKRHLWKKSPTLKKQMQPYFQVFSDDDLRTATVEIVLQPDI